MLSSILAPLTEGAKGFWPPLGVDSALTLWYEAVARIRVQLMHWMDKQSKHVPVRFFLSFFLKLKFYLRNTKNDNALLQMFGISLGLYPITSEPRMPHVS